MKAASREVAEVWEGYPPFFRQKLAALRSLILEVAEGLPETGGIEETLKWGEPSYLPRKKNVGTTVRIHWKASQPDQYGMYFNCNTSLVPMFKQQYPGTFRYEGNRAIVFEKGDEIAVEPLKDCISMALTYHRRKKNAVLASD